MFSCVRRALPGVLLLVLVVVGTGWAQKSNAPTEPLALVRCGALLDGKSETARKNVIIAIRGEKIAEVGATEPASGAEVIDLSRETCLPGLIDTHTHVLLQGDITAADYDEQLLKQSTEYRAILATVNARRAWNTDSRRFATWRPRALDMPTSI